MVNFVGYISNNFDADMIKAKAEFAGALHEDEDELRCFIAKDINSFCSRLKSATTVDICCYDTKPLSELHNVKKTRIAFPQMLLVLVADESISPTEYIKPGILPGALLIRPLFEETVFKTMNEVVTYIHNTRRMSSGAKFVVETRQEKIFVDYSDILYFEALDKKIFLNTKNRSYSFYKSLDSLSEELPTQFIRCHRSYIVNTNHITGFDYSQGILSISNGMTIPVARSYKSVVKEGIL